MGESIVEPKTNHFIVVTQPGEMLQEPVANQAGSSSQKRNDHQQDSGPQ
jgi:hypothetical protein